MQKIVNFSSTIRILSHACAVGYEESRGPFSELFDFHDPTDRFGEKTWETAEEALSGVVLSLALKKAGFSHEKLDLLFAGDLQNQCVASSSGLSSFGIPYFGLYGACSTSAEGLFLGATALQCRDLSFAAAVTTSHNAAAERQFRLPLEYGGQRTPTAQWTVTGGGAFLLTNRPEYAGAIIRRGLPGIPCDAGITDAANMGAAMAPAAAKSIESYLRLTESVPEDYDAIVTGDLGREGSAILKELLSQAGIDMKERHMDCGCMIYDSESQKEAHAGGSGCGCSASMLSAYFLPLLERKEMRRILFSATGALMSPSNLLQGRSIIGIAPVLEMTGG